MSDYDYNWTLVRMRQLVLVPRKEITMPPEGAHGTCGCGSPLGGSCHGFVGLIDHINRYLLVMVDCFSRWTEACPLPYKTAISVADAFFSNIVCRFGMPSVMHSDQGREFENKIMHELCLLGGSHKTKTTPYHPESDGLVERFNRTLNPLLPDDALRHHPVNSG